jgi:hypothetical protein
LAIAATLITFVKVADDMWGSTTITEGNIAAVEGVKS